MEYYEQVCHKYDKSHETDKITETQATKDSLKKKQITRIACIFKSNCVF